MDLPASLGEFRISAILGRGGSGVVYDATWGPRKVALKVLDAGQVGTGRERQQFLEEAHKLQQIGHPSVVKVFAVGQLPDGRPYLAMERLDGETLAQLVAKGPLALPVALELFAELCSAVGALHDQGLVHRDLKPENVYVVDGRHAVLLDFGIAKQMSSAPSTTTQEGNVRGTPAYMAPERFFGQPAGIATDVYELALVLYAMLAGRLPWDAVADPEARLSPRPLVELAPVPEALDIEIRRALSTRAQNRPGSASALLTAVRAAATGATPPTEAVATARLRSGEQRAAEPARPPGDRAPTPEQQTPLAWAPTQAAQSAHPRPRRWWPWATGAAAVVAAIGVFAYVRTRPAASVRPASTLPPQSVTPDAAIAHDDPWAVAKTTEETPKALPLVEDKLTPETYRAEALAAISRLPADTHLVFTAEVGELRANTQTDDLLDRLAKYPKVQMLSGAVPPCVKALASDAEWIVFGAASLHGSEHGVLVLRGRWRRNDVEACFANTVKPDVTSDGGRLYRIGDLGWLDFIDTHTAYITVRPDLEPEKVHQLVRHGAGPQGHARDLVARLAADRSLAFVADGEAKDDWSALSLPQGTDVFGWIRVDADGATLDLVADPHQAAAAKTAVATIKPQIDQLFTGASTAQTGKLEVVQVKTEVHLRGTVTNLMLGMVSMGLDR